MINLVSSGAVDDHTPQTALTAVLILLVGLFG
ncbi:hypothetical protein KCP73_11550 [Salmonella enterica subsp. enterica]|nr:hypothetical protein KCP73_11550 [Salmonella enterica subsp. enterica]